VNAHAVLLDGARLCEGDTPLPLDISSDIERIPCSGRTP